VRFLFPSGLTNLRLLNVSHNLIEYLPDALTTLHGLQELNVSHNRLFNTCSRKRMEEDKVFSMALGENLTDLRTLLLGHNKLSWIPAGVLSCGLRCVQFESIRFALASCSMYHAKSLPRPVSPPCCGPLPLPHLLGLSLSLIPSFSCMYISILVRFFLDQISLFKPLRRSILDVCHNDIEFVPDFQQHHEMPEQLR